MDIGRSINDQFNFNILCSRLGNTPTDLYDKVLSLLSKSCHKILFPNVLPKEFVLLAKEKAPSKDWFMGWVNCKYFASPPAVEWAESQIFYKCHAALIIIDMATCDPDQYGPNLTKIKRSFASENIQCYSILIWNPLKSHFVHFEKEKECEFVPEKLTNENLADFLYKKIQVLLIRTAIHFFRSIEKLTTDSHTIALFNAKEEVPKDHSKVKKKKQGRAIKICGDLVLILGCWNDAEAYYAKAYKQLDLNDDYIWLGKVKEGQMACLYLQFLFGEAEQDSVERITRRLTKEAKEKLEAASNLYKKVKTTQALESETELYFKRLHLFKDLKASVEFNELFKHYPEIAKLGLKGEGIYKGMLLVSNFFYEMKMYRKSGLFLKLLADTVVVDQYDFTLARDIYLACFPLYHMPLPEGTLPSTFPKYEFLKVIHENKDLGRQVLRIAPKLQLQLIRDVMKLSLNDKPLEAKMLAIIMHYFMEDLDPQTQRLLFGKLIEIGNSLNSNLNLDLELLPKVTKIILVPETMKINVKYIDKDAGKGAIFIYNPWKDNSGGNTEDYNWMEGSFCCVKVHLSNNFPFEIFVEMITLVTEGIQTINYPVSVTMKRKLPLQELTLKFKPLEAGKLNILGILVKLSNYVYFHPISNKGIALGGETSRKTAQEKIGIRDVLIRERINTLKMYFEDEEEVIEISKKSPFHTRVVVENKNECVINVHKILMTFIFTDASVLDQEFIPAVKEVKEYEVFSIVVYRSLFGEEEFEQDLFKNELNVMLSLNVDSIPNIDSLSKIYIKLIYYEKNKPKIYIEEYISKFVHIKKGLSVGKMDVYDSFSKGIVQLNGKGYKHINVDEEFFLTLEVKKNDPLNDENEYAISFERRDTKEILGQNVLSSTHHNTRIVIKMSRDAVLGFDRDPDFVRNLILGRWKERDLLGKGYLLLDEVDVSPLINKIESCHMKINLDIDIPKREKDFIAEIKQFYTMKVRISWLKEVERKKLYCVVVVSDDSDLDNILVMKNEKRVIYQGKRAHKLELNEEMEASFYVKVMFTENRTFKAFCFVIDEKENTLYSFKHPNCIITTY